MAALLQLVYVISLRLRFENRVVGSGDVTETLEKNKKREILLLTDKIDKRSCVLFKLVYLAFNVVYWSYFLSR